jgi:urease accessory protein
MNSKALQSDHKFDSKRWRAKFSGEFVCVNGHTRMGLTEHFGPLRVQRPFYPEGLDCLHVYLLHPPGGLVGGDKLSIELNAKENAHILMTTPSAGKIYRNISGIKQGQHVDITVANDAIVEYLPQENIIFDHADAELITQVNIKGSGIYIGWEITCLGRIESNDLFTEGGLQQSLSVFKDQKPLFLDRLTLRAPSDLQTGKAGFQNKIVFGTFIISRDVTTPDMSDELAEWQENMNQSIAPASIAITQKPGVFIARIIGDKAEQARDTFESLWVLLRPKVINKKACAPRIWRT